MYKGMQQMVKANIVNLLQKKLEAQDASVDSSDMNESEHLDKLFVFYTKQALTLVVRELQRFLKVLLIKSFIQTSSSTA